ncbi:DUF7344 domain-containing protein [Halovivax cerinus]|uniref:DUF7344 domain-containing protein n=1 Tax=Halovivax cerinus TaxID=1487865 RepID=A0ABD5NMI6_9EURY|nr:hypothetical protein [Halovivax cerinus]
MNAPVDHRGQISIDPDFPLPVAVDLLSNRRRRRVIEVLTTHPESLTLDELAGTLVDDETLPVDCVETLRIELHHSHLPKLADLGVIGYDRETHRIRRLAGLSSLVPLLEVVMATENGG